MLIAGSASSSLGHSCFDQRVGCRLRSVERDRRLGGCRARHGLTSKRWRFAFIVTKVVRHTRAERSQLHAAGVAVYFAVASSLDRFFPVSNDMLLVLFAAGVAFVDWFVLDWWLTRRRGVLVTYDWSPRGNRLTVRLHKGVKRLAFAKVVVSDYSGRESLLTILQIKQAILAELAKVRSEFSAAPEIHFVGFSEEGVGIFAQFLFGPFGSMLLLGIGDRYVCKRKIVRIPCRLSSSAGRCRAPFCA